MSLNWPLDCAHLADEPANLTTVTEDSNSTTALTTTTTSPRLELVELATAVKDADVMRDYVATCQDPLILEFTHVPEGYTEAMAQEFVNQPGTVRWAILADDRYAGNIEVRLIDEGARCVDVGYMTSPQFRGQGIMTRALRMVLNYCFDQGVHRFEGKAAVHNAASRHVMEQAGMRFEGIARGAEYLHGSYNDLAVYGRLATDEEGNEA
ncbi:Putative ribosomal N-acetyltransferase YdaF [Corynebacterium urogenitale]|uniref:Ribosomal N-acetyltransferase YdaF n=1 Tax=Corynebacterium urogenitale TaxID=2487892 RepID=A0A5J6Z545_9CORY|nr:GNAT family protein [Corynebacterium urogenitale]QFQ01471.1 Putative ribosomal N-acetyltransferase YdaF [Corynebacterium urogenitale]